MIQRTFSLLGTVCILSLGAFFGRTAGATSEAWQAPASATRWLLAADAGEATAAAAVADSPDGMGHLPGHLHEIQASDEDPAAGAHDHHHGADGVHPGSEEGETDACEGMDQDDHGEGHHMMMGGHAHGGSAGHGHGSYGGHPESEDATLEAISAPPPPAWLHGIELSEEQQDRIFAILHESAAAQRKAQRVAERTHRQLAHIGMASDYSEAAARKLSDQHAQAIGELTMLRVRNEKRILEVLTSEQRRDAAHQAARED